MDGKKKHSTCRQEPEPHRQSNDPPFVPMDFWAEILLRIPAEDLVKLKIVCKCWYELITRDQSFARLHLDHWTRSRPPFSGFSVHTNCPVDWFLNSSILYFTVHLDCEEEGKFQYRDFLIKYCYYGVSIEYRLLASCNGLLLIAYAKEDRYQLVICNPITGTYRKLPIFQPPDGRFSGLFSESISKDYEWAMVRNASNGQYKVFGMTRMNPRRTCHVFELQRDGHEEHLGHNWKELDAPLPLEWFLESSTATEGRVHWFLLTGVMLKVKILSIDVLTDELRTSASIELLPGMDLCSAWNGTFYCTQWRDHELRLWALENFDNPTLIEKGGSVCHDPPWSLTGQFDMAGGVKLVTESSGCNYNVILEATETGCSSYLIINWIAEKVVRHVNSLIGFN